MAHAYSPVPNCPDTTGNHLNYLTATNAYLCGNSGGGSSFINLGTSSSVTNPQRSGDATTGLFSPIGTSVAISVAGSEIMRVNATGVGVGTTAPAALLSVGTTNLFQVNGSGIITGVGTNLTGTAAGLTAGNVTTNANLTGPITSVGNATSIASQTGTGTTFVMQASPAITTPTFTTNATVPLVIGGSAGNDTLTLESTSSGTHTTDAIIFKTGAQAEAARINSGSQVMIGTSLINSGYLMGISGAVGTQLQLNRTGASAFASGIQWTLDNAQKWITLSGCTSGLYDFCFKNAGNTIIFDILQAGNTAIGTTAPKSMLDVYGSAAIGTSYAGVTAAPANGLIVQGNVGIGTNVPRTALDVWTGTVTANQYNIGAAQIACSNLSNGTTGCSTATGTSGATTPLLNGTNTWSGVQTFNSGNIILGSNKVINQVVKQIFTGGGTYTPTTGMVYAQMECIGGGGAGGGVTGSLTGNGAGGGGGGGNYSRILSTAVTIGTSQAVTIGAGGTAGASGAAGNAGGDTSVGTLCVGKGGGGGGANAGGGNTAPGGSGGVAGTGDLTIRGSDGEGGQGASILTAVIISGSGGTAYFGGGVGPVRPSAACAAGNAGYTYGGGGGGGGCNASSSSTTGGVGGAGVVYITEYVSN